MTTLALIVFAQIQLGGDAGVSYVKRINCSGFGLNCSSDGTVGTIAVAPGAGVRGATPLYVDGGYMFCDPATPAVAGCMSVAPQSFGGNKSFPDGISTPHIDGGPLMSVGATSMRFYGSDALWNQSVSFANNATYFTGGGTASADFYNGLATGGPVIPNTNATGLALWGRRVDGNPGVAVKGQHWIDGGVQFAVYLPVCGASNQAQFGVTTDNTFFGSAASADCTGSSDLNLGALVDNGGAAGHTSMMTGAKLSLNFLGNLSGNHTAWELPGPVAPVAATYNTPYNSTVVCTDIDAGTYFCYAGRHGTVIAGTREEMKQGWLFEVSNSGRASGNHVFYVSYWGSFGQDDQIEFTNFPAASSPTIVTTEGQYVYQFAGELAHDRMVLGNYTTGKWRVREANPDGGMEWLYLVDSNDPIPTTQLSGLVAATQGGTGLGAPIDDTVPVGTSGNLYSSAILPNCTDTGGQHLNYIAASNAFSCGTSGGASSPLTTKGDIYTFSTVNDRLPVSTDGLCLKALASASTGLEWGSCSAGGGISYAEAAAAVMGGF